MINKVILMGRLTRDPEVKATPGGASVCTFTVAVDRRFVKQGEQRQADFLNCVAWRQTAEFIGKYFTKGQMIAVVGSVQTRTWDDNEGKKRYATDIVVDEVSFCGGRNEGSGMSSRGEDSQLLDMDDDGFTPIGSDDDLPF